MNVEEFLSTPLTTAFETLTYKLFGLLDRVLLANAFKYITFSVFKT